MTIFAGQKLIKMLPRQVPVASEKQVSKIKQKLRKEHCQIRVGPPNSAHSRPNLAGQGK
jgi:hypothetical protein